MRQPGLFDAVQPFPHHEPIAASVDPASSHIAAREITKSRLRGRQKLQVLYAVKAYPLHTSAELAQLWRLDRHLKCPTCAGARMVSETQYDVTTDPVLGPKVAGGGAGAPVRRRSCRNAYAGHGHCQPPPI